MIAFLEGKVVERFATSVVVNVGGVGYEVQVASAEYERALPNEQIKLYTYHHVREQSEELFGFSSLAGKRLFELLITVQGIGPKAALSILSLGEVEAVRSGIASEDIKYISSANGVGKKTAEKMIVTLRDKVGSPTYIPGGDNGVEIVNAAGDEALDALMALGYNIADATTALKDVPTDKTTAERVKLALKQKNSGF